MSVERLNHPGIYPLADSVDSRLPLIFEIIRLAIKSGAVKTPLEFIEFI